MDSNELRRRALNYNRLSLSHSGTVAARTYREKAKELERQADALDAQNASLTMSRSTEADNSYISKPNQPAPPVARPIPKPNEPTTPTATSDNTFTQQQLDEASAWRKWNKEITASGGAGGYDTVIPFDPNNPANNPSREQTPDAVNLKDAPELNPTDNAPVADRSMTDDYKIWRERIQLATGKGEYGQPITNSLMGFNHRNVTDPVPQGRDYNPMVFYVRPGINLAMANISNSRRWVDRIRQPRSSIDYSIMAALDTQWPLGFAKPEDARMGRPYTADVLFDNRQAFIPILSRLCTNVSGFSDNNIDSYTSPEGVMREQYILADSTWEINEFRTFSTTFNPVVGNIVEHMITVWLEYISGRIEGRFQKRMSDWVQRRVDYFSSIYSLSTDPLGRIVQFDCIPECYPINNNAGAKANVDMSKWSSPSEPTTIQWAAVGTRYFDPLYMERFNDTVALANPDMIPDPNADQSDGFVPIGAAYLRKIKHSELNLFNWMGYPHIDSERRVLEWYVYQEDYDYIMKRGGLS